LKKPGIYLKELQEELLLSVDISGFTRQKLCFVALQTDTLLRENNTLDISVYKPEMLIFLDETGADQRNAVRRYGYSLRGMPIQKESLFVRGERVSAIAFISISGVLDLLVLTKKNLLPQLQPFNGINSDSVIIMDNCTIHGS
jgi:hypothetical protein